MRAWQLTWTELRRVTSTRMGRLTVLALMLVPTLYAGLYLYANHDPYAALDRVPAALVVADEGATAADGTTTNTGRQVADELLESGDFGWHEVDAAEAEKGVERGRYDFALVIPPSLSRSLTSVAGTDPEQARLRLLTNDANSYLSTTIANTVVDKVSTAITQQVGKEAALQFLTGIADTRQGLLDGSDGAGTLHDGIVEARNGARTLKDGAVTLHEGTGDLAEGAGTLRDGLATLETATADLPTQSKALADGAQKVADGDATIAQYGATARALVKDVRTAHDERRPVLRQRLTEAGLTPAQRREVLDIYDEVGVPIRDADAKAAELSGKLTTLAEGAQKVADGAKKLSDAAPDLSAGIATAHTGSKKLATGATDLDEGAGKIADGATSLHQGLKKLAGGSAQLRDKLKDGAAQIPATDQEARERAAATISDPVQVRNISSAAAGSYGEGLAPFFMALAAWIGGYVLFLMVRPLSTRALAANQPSWRVALGGWGAPALIGVAQMVLAVGVVSLVVGVLPSHVPAVLGVLVLASLTFVAVVHCLCATLGSPGKFLGLVLMVLQLVSAGGTFPWQTIPEPMHVLHQVMPMPHAVDALRLVMYGGPGDLVWSHLAVLLAWLVGALLLTTLAAHRHRVWTPSRVDPEFVL